MVESLLRV